MHAKTVEIRIRVQKHSKWKSACKNICAENWHELKSEKLAGKN